jgi:APA family basic amino acid/polyamine antiporter
MKKPLGIWRTWSLVVGTMIGSGVFLLPSALAPYGSYSIWGWVITGVGTLFIALTLGSLAARIPRIGGPYAYTRAAFGDFPAFLIAWGYWISLWASIAAVAVAYAAASTFRIQERVSS